MPYRLNKRNGQETFPGENANACMDAMGRKIHVEETKPLSTQVAGHQYGKHNKRIFHFNPTK